MSGFPWRTLLFVSVALNLLGAGAVVGALSAGVRVERQTPPEAVVDRMPGPRAFLAALPAETRSKMRAELTDSWVESRPARRTAAQARREAFATAAAEPYDAARVREAFARMRVADQAAIAAFHDNVAEAFAGLSPEERREALRALRRAAPARHRNAAPSADDASVAPANGEAARPSTLEERRERRRERRRQRREQSHQQDGAPER